VRLDRICAPTVFAPLLLTLCAGISYWLADRSLPNPDEGASLTAAAKILRGGVFYREIDAYPFPGSYYLLALAMSIFGEHLSVARALAGASWCATVLGVYAAALRLTSQGRAALCGLSLLALKFWAFPSFNAYLYSDLAIAFAVVALAVFLRRDPGNARADTPVRLVVLGVLAGLAVLAKQSTGIYLGGAITALLLWPGVRGPRPWRDVGMFAAGFCGVAVPTALYFASEGLLGQMIFSGLIRPFTGYLPTSGVSILPPLAWWEIGQLREGAGQPYLPLLFTDMIRFGLLPGSSELWWIGVELFSRVVYASLLLAFASCGIHWLRGRRDPGFVASACICIAIAASAFPRADYPHVINIYPVVLLTLFALGTGARIRAASAAVVVGLLLTGVLALRYDGFLTHRLSLERAALWVRASDAWVAPVVATIQRDVSAGEPIFIYGHEAHYYFLTDRYFPWPFSQLYPGMAGGDGGRSLAAVLREARPLLVLEGVGHWPGMPRLAGYTGDLKAMLDRLYHDESHAIAPASELPPRWVFGLLRLRAP
jgi:4-amino-4-deoxy-L-arabinose transferase-like glycosyltransferase